MPANPAYAAALEELDRHVNFERSGEYPAGSGGLGTARCEELLARLGAPEAGAPAIHVAGTKGKGSTAHLAAAALRARGWRVGLYTSPHVVCLRERIQIDGRFVSQNDFATAFAKVREAAAAMASRPTYFEMLTAVAFVAFAEARVDAVVAEVGLGGRLDATNLARLPVVASCVTPISLDHTQILGDTLGKIAAEKAGILRPRTPLVLARQTPEARQAILARAAELACPVLEVGRDVAVEIPPIAPGAEAGRFTLRIAPGALPRQPARELADLPLALAGAHQRENAAAAFALAQVFCDAREASPVSREELARAWKNLRVPGRLEIVGARPVIVLDGAHNPASAWALTETLRGRFPDPGQKKVAVVSVSRDKDVREFLHVILPCFDRVFFTANHSGRGAAPGELLATARELFPRRDNDWQVVDTPENALEQALAAAGEEGMACVTGSFYLVGDLRPRCLRVPPED